MGHFIESHLAPFRNNFIFSRRHRRQTGPVYRAMGWGALLLPLSVPVDLGAGHTRRRFLGRQPLWGIGGTPLITDTSMPVLLRDRQAVPLPDPAPCARK